jgi:hypothetical protein
MLDRTLIQIRERGFLDLLDLALVVVRARPVTLGLAAAVGIAPFAAWNAWLMTVPDFPGALLVLLIMMEAPWATAPLTIVLGGLMFGSRPSVRGVLATLARSFGSMLLFQGIVRGVLMVTGIFYLLVPARLVFANEVILLERERWRVIRRCGQLTDQREGGFLARWVAQLIFGGLFLAVFWIGATALAYSLVSSELTWDTPDEQSLFDFRAQLAIWISIAFFTVARFLMYIDQRIRLEGWEVELRLRAVGRALEESRTW